MNDMSSMSRESRKDQLRRRMITPGTPRRLPEEDSEEVVKRAHKKAVRRRLRVLAAVLVLLAVCAGVLYWYQRFYQLKTAVPGWERQLEREEGSFVGYERFGENLLKYSKDEAADLLDHLQNKNQRLYRYTGVVVVYARTREELEDRAVQVASTARRNSIDLEPLSYRQLQGLNTALPLGNDHVGPTRMLTTAQVAVQIPFATQELFDEGGGYYGQNKHSGNLVLCDRKRLASPMGYVAGKPGSGKSFSVKREIENTVLAHPEDQVLVFDPAGEYSLLVEANGGRVIRLAPGSRSRINPFDMSDVGHLAPAARMASKIDAVTAMASATMAEGAEGLTEADRSIIARCVEASYARARGATPTLGDFQRELAAQPEPEARDMALRFERYVTGAMSFLDGQSDADLSARVTSEASSSAFTACSAIEAKGTNVLSISLPSVSRSKNPFSPHSSNPLPSRQPL